MAILYYKIILGVSVASIGAGTCRRYKSMMKHVELKLPEPDPWGTPSKVNSFYEDDRREKYLTPKGGYFFGQGAYMAAKDAKPEEERPRF